MSLSVFKLMLSIILYQRILSGKAASSCASNFGNNNSLESSTEYCRELLITGSQNSYKVFTSIPKETRSNLTSLTLVFTRFKVDVLLESLKGCLNLETLNLTIVEWEGEFSNKVYLPKLKNFIFTTLRSFDFKSATDITAYIFFYKKSKNWEQDEKLWKTTDIILDGRKYYDTLKIVENELELGRLDDLYSTFLNVVLRSRQIKKLKLERTSIGPHLLKYFHKIKELKLAEISFVETSVSDVIQSCVEAEEILINAYVEPESVDLALIPAKVLKFLRLRSVSLRWSSNGLPVRFEKLEHFLLSSCDFLPSLICLSPALKTLELSQVNTLNGSINDLFKSKEFSTLNELSISQLDGENPTLDISLIPSVEKLSLKNCRISASSMNSPQIGWLVFDQVKIQESVVQNFSRFFKNTTMIDIPNKISPLMLKEIFKTEVRSLRFQFDWNAKEDYPEQYQHAVSFLTDLRIPDGYAHRIHLESNGTAFEYIFVNESLYEYRNGIKFITVYKPIVYSVCSFGLIGNTISALVLSRTEMLKFSSSYILLGLAFWDSIFLITSLVEFVWISFQLDGGQFNEFIARIMQILLYPVNKIAYTGSVYLTLLITIDRFIAVSMPLRAKTVLTSKRTRKNIWILAIFSAILNFTRCFESISWDYPLDGRYWNSYRRPSLVMSSEYREFYLLYAWSFFMYVIPFVLMMVLNLKIWIEVRRANKARRGLAGKQSNTDTSITKMLMSVVILFLICNSINALIVWYFIYSGSSAGLGTIALDYVVIEILAFQPLLINSSANFIIYCAMGTKFRGECRQLFCNIFKICQTHSMRKPHRVTSDTGVSDMQIRSSSESAHEENIEITRL